VHNLWLHDCPCEMMPEEISREIKRPGRLVVPQYPRPFFTPSDIQMTPYESHCSLGDRATCLKIAGSGNIRSCIFILFPDHLVSEGAWRSSICCHHESHLTAYGEVRDGE
jgi:hypothetical protein